MKKFFVITLIAIALVSQSVKAQFSADTTDLKMFNSPTGRSAIETICHATFEVVAREGKNKEVKKYKENDWYTLYSNDGSTPQYAPVKGEQMLEYNGEYFYSLTKHAFVKKFTPIKLKVQRQQGPVLQILTGVVATAGQVILQRTGNW